MALASMTGFAEARGAHAGLRWRWEVRSVNGRALDLRLRMPPGFEGVEAGARTLAAERFKRGSLQAVLTVVPDEGARGFRIDPAALADAVRIAKRVAEETGLPPARVDGLLALRGVVVQDDMAALDDEARMARDAALLESLATAFDALGAARTAEGAKLKAVLSVQVKEIETRTRAARTVAATQPAALRERLMAQVAELSSALLPEERIAQEVALLAAKADLREELDRLEAHCQEARALLTGAEASGRKLDFLAQEFNREANTLCAKAAGIELTRIGLALKAVIDQFREQVANVE
jgi:uncharacterized protein (TIGR00255 family)